MSLFFLNLDQRPLMGRADSKGLFGVTIGCFGDTSDGKKKIYRTQENGQISVTKFQIK